jgi:DNA polymerase
MEPFNPASAMLARAKRDSSCRGCKLYEYASNVCIFGNGPVPAEGMIVGEGPSAWDDRWTRSLTAVSPAGIYLDSVLRENDLDRSDLFITNATKCIAPKDMPNRDTALEQAQKACTNYLSAEIAAVKPKAILAMGKHAYFYFTHSAGIMKHRGQAQWDPIRNLWVLPTIHPNFVMNNPAYHVAFSSDVASFRRLILGITTQPQVNLIEIHTIEDFRKMMKDLADQGDKILTFDLETRGFLLFDPNRSKIWCAAATRGNRTGDAIDSYLIPLEHPESPFLTDIAQMREVVLGFCNLMLTARTNGHNGKYDARGVRTLLTRYESYTDKQLEEECRKLRTLELWPAPKKKATRKTKAQKEAEEETTVEYEIAEVDD